MNLSLRMSVLGAGSGCLFFLFIIGVTTVTILPLVASSLASLIIGFPYVNTHLYCEKVNQYYNVALPAWIVAYGFFSLLCVLVVVLVSIGHCNNRNRRGKCWSYSFYTTFVIAMCFGLAWNIVGTYELSRSTQCISTTIGQIMLADIIIGWINFVLGLVWVFCFVKLMSK